MIKRGELNGKSIIEGIADNRVTKNMYKYVETADGVSLAERKDDGTVTPVTPVPPTPARDRVRVIIENANYFYKIDYINDSYKVDEHHLYNSTVPSKIYVGILYGTDEVILSYSHNYDYLDQTWMFAFGFASNNTFLYVALYDELYYKDGGMQEEESLPSNLTKEEFLAAYDALED